MGCPARHPNKNLSMKSHQKLCVAVSKAAKEVLQDAKTIHNKLDRIPTNDKIAFDGDTDEVYLKESQVRLYVEMIEIDILKLKNLLDLIGEY